MKKNEILKILQIPKLFSWQKEANKEIFWDQNFLKVEYS